MLDLGIEETKRKLRNLLGMMAWKKGMYENQHMEERERLFQDSKQADRAFSLLKESRILDYFYHVESLRIRYSEYAEKNKVEFSFEELFDEGWLVECMGEWHFNILVKSHYMDIEPLTTEKEEQILTFLKGLAVHPYEDGIWLVVPKGSDTEGLKGVTGLDSEITYLDPHGKYWERSGAVLLGRWWDEIMELEESDEEGRKEKERQKEQWFISWKSLHRCWRPDRYCEYTQELFGFCLEKLEKETEKLTWERMRHILGRWLYVQETSIREKGYEKFLADIPDSPFTGRFYIEEYGNWFWNMGGAFAGLHPLYSLCIGQYPFVGGEYRRRFLKCLSHPWIYLQLKGFLTGSSDTWLLSDCLGNSELCVAAAGIAWERGYDFSAEFPGIGRNAMEELSQCIFEILKNGLKGRDRDRWIQSMKDLMWYLGKKSGWCFKGQKVRRRYLGDVHDLCMQWYKKNILPEKELHGEITEYFYEKFEKGEGIDVTLAFAEYAALEGLCRSKEAAEHLLEIYKIYISRVIREDVLASQLSWSFWQDSLWIHMMEEAAVREDRTEEFLNLLDPQMFREEVERQKGRSPILQVGQAAMIQLYMITILLLEARGRLNDEMREQTETVFTECFAGFQEDAGCDLFDMGHIRLLRADGVVRRCMEILPSLGEDQRGYITFMMRKQPANKILALLKYIQHQDIRKRWMRILYQKADYRERVYSLDVYAQVIDLVLDIGFRDEDKDADGKLVGRAKEMLADFQKTVAQRGERLQKEFASWIQSAGLRIKMLQGNEKEILEEAGDAQVIFYQALICLNRDDLESLKRSAELYQKCIGLGEEKAEEKSSAYVNYFAACVRICTHEEAGEDDREGYLQEARDAADKIRNKYTLSPEEEKVLCSYELYLYAELDDTLRFWTAASRLPGELKYEYSCAQYLIQVYAKSGYQEKAKKYLEELFARYGKTDKLAQLEQKIIETSSGIRDLPQPVFSEESRIQKYIDNLNRLKNLTEYESALVHLQRDDLDNPEEVNLLKMVLDATQKLSEYSLHLIFDEKTAEEDRYSKFIQTFFEQKEKDIWDYYMKDQTKEGSTGHRLKNKREGTGSIDLLIYHNTDKVGLIEGIKIEYTEKENLKDHIRKIAGYNYADMPTTFLLILADMEKPGEFWKEYEQEILPELTEETKNNEWHITEQVSKEQTELVRKHIRRTPLYMCMTVHTCENAGKEFHLYHIMVDIRKTSHKKEASASRNKKQNDRR